jgi:hypothetical protein
LISRAGCDALTNSARLILAGLFLQSVDSDQLQAMLQIFIVPCLNCFYSSWIARMENTKLFSTHWQKNQARHLFELPGNARVLF